MRKLKALLAILSLLGVIMSCTEATTSEVITNDKKPEYKISFNANGGKGKMSDINIVAETSIILPENTFMRDNYTFIGWSTTADGKVMFEDGAIFEGLYSNVTLYAKWEKEVTSVVEITITFDVNGAGGTAPTAIETTSDENVELPVLTNAKFSHWNTSPDGSGQSYKTTATFTESVTLYAILLAENAHTITYELDGGVNHPENKYSFTEDDTVVLRDPTKEGYTFAGWYETADFSGEKIELWYEGGKTANVTLYAKWVEISSGIFLAGLNGSNWAASSDFGNADAMTECENDVWTFTFTAETTKPFPYGFKFTTENGWQEQYHVYDKNNPTDDFATLQLGKEAEVYFGTNAELDAPDEDGNYIPDDATKFSLGVNNNFIVGIEYTITFDKANMKVKITGDFTDVPTYTIEYVLTESWKSDFTPITKRYSGEEVELPTIENVDT